MKERFLDAGERSDAADMRNNLTLNVGDHSISDSGCSRSALRRCAVAAGCLGSRSGTAFSGFSNPEEKATSAIPEFYYDIIIVVLLQSIGSLFVPGNDVTGAQVATFALFFAWAFWNWATHVYYHILYEEDDWMYRVETIARMIGTVWMAMGVQQGLGDSTCIFAMGVAWNEGILALDWIRVLHIKATRMLVAGQVVCRLGSFLVLCFAAGDMSLHARACFLAGTLVTSMIIPAFFLKRTALLNHLQIMERMVSFTILVCAGFLFASLNSIIDGYVKLKDAGIPITADLTTVPGCFWALLVWGLLLPFSIMLVYAGNPLPLYAESNYYEKKCDDDAEAIRLAVGLRYRLYAFAYFYVHALITGGVIALMCSISMLQLDTSDEPPRYVWKSSAVLLFICSFAAVYAGLCIFHLTCDTSRGSNVERSACRAITAALGIIILGICAANQDPFGFVRHPMRLLASATVLSIFNAWVDTMGFSHRWKWPSQGAPLRSPIGHLRGQRMPSAAPSPSSLFKIRQESFDTPADNEKAGTPPSPSSLFKMRNRLSFE